MERELTIVQLNDSHGYVDLHHELFWTASGPVYRKAGGYARLATLLRQIRAERPGAVLAFDNGDTIHGTYPAVQTRGAGLVPLLNLLRFDAMTAHWEFAYGPERLQALARQLAYPLLAANVYAETGGRPLFEGTHSFEAGGLRVGVVGIASNIVDKTMPPQFSKGVRFTLGVDEARSAVERLRTAERVDLVLVLSHLGFPQDAQLAKQIPGIDVVLSGHTHNRLTQPVRVGKTVIIQSGSHGSFLGRLDLRVDGSRITDIAHRLITVDEGIEEDRDMQAEVDELMRPHRKELDRVVGRTATGLNRNTLLESTMDNLLLQSLLEATGARVAFSNGWRYGAPVPPGPVTVNDLYNIIPMNPPVMTVDLTGEEIQLMLEENLERTLSRDPFGQMGGYVKRMLGLKLYAKVENPRGERVQQIFVGNEPLDPARLYPATFVTEQGVGSAYGTNRREAGMHAVDALEQIFTRPGPVAAELRGSVLLV